MFRIGASGHVDQTPQNVLNVRQFRTQRIEFIERRFGHGVRFGCRSHVLDEFRITQACSAVPGAGAGSQVVDEFEELEPMTLAAQELVQVEAVKLPAQVDA